MSLIDSHCHLKSFHDKGDLKEVLDRADEAGVTKLVTVGTSFDDWSLYKDLSFLHEGKIFYTVGIHPSYVTKEWEKYTEVICRYWEQKNIPVAIGEIGLDYFRLPKDKNKADEIIENQKNCFYGQLLIAKQLGCPVVIHSRNAFRDCVNMILKAGIAWSKVVFHCFSESHQKAFEILEYGGNLSFTGMVTYSKNTDLIKTIKCIKGNQFMVETDCPYLSPEPFRKFVNEPSRLPLIIESLASILETNVKVIENITSNQAMEFFSLS